MLILDALGRERVSEREEREGERKQEAVTGGGGG